jgi:hypothetical protein
MRALPAAQTEATRPARVAPRRDALFSVAIVLLPCVLLLTAAPIARTGWFVRRSQDVYLPNVAYGLTLHNANCEVVVYGDSSALTGVDPAIVEHDAGLKTCNIAEYEGVFELFRLLIPDEFFRRNRAPRYLVMTFCPWNLAPYEDWAKSTTFEAILLRLRAFPDIHTGEELALHPSQTFDFLTRTLRMAATAPLHRELSPDLQHYREEHQGFMFRPGDAMPDCSTFSDRVREPDPKWIEEMRQRYTRYGTHVLVDVTPLPSCAESLGFYTKRLRGRTDNGLQPWPPQLFNGSGHFTREGAASFSRSIAAQIRLAAGGR